MSNSFLPFAFLLSSLLASPQVICGIRIDVDRSPSVFPAGDTTLPDGTGRLRLWRNLSDRELIARTILSEQGARILNPAKRIDSIGVGFVVWNRTRGLHPGFDYALHDVFRAVSESNQFNGLTNSANIVRAAYPDGYWRWYGTDTYAGHRAYWLAIAIAQCITTGKIEDPTGGALFFSDHHYGIDGGLMAYADERTRFRVGYGDSSYVLSGQVVYTPKSDCIDVEMC